MKPVSHEDLDKIAGGAGRVPPPDDIRFPCPFPRLPDVPPPWRGFPIPPVWQG